MWGGGAFAWASPYPKCVITNLATHQQFWERGGEGQGKREVKGNAESLMQKVVGLPRAAAFGEALSVSDFVNVSSVCFSRLGGGPLDISNI